MRPKKARGFAAVVSSIDTNEPESIKKLRGLKEKIAREWDQERKERHEAETKETIVPLSLAAEYTKEGRRGAARKAMNDKLMGVMKEKIQSLKIDRMAQRDLESELEKKAQEANSLRSHNVRLRDIISLTQESYVRREEQLEEEIARTKAFADSVCVSSIDMDQKMQDLREMNQRIQQGATELAKNIQHRSEAELLNLIRTYRVRMRELKQHIGEQERQNYQGAEAWIRRFDVLTKDCEAARTNLESLETTNKMLQMQNQELTMMTQHQEEQRNTLMSKIAVVKRENKRLEEQIAMLEQELLEKSGGTASLSPDPRPVRLLRSRERSAPRPTTVPDRPKIRSTPFTLVDKRQTDALARVKRTLEAMRTSLKKVRAAHVELLHERSELEAFLRQCMEDVRNDMYRVTVVSTFARGISGDRLEENSVLQEYGAKEKKQLIDILNSKLKILALLHTRMFPQKTLVGEYEPLGEFELALDRPPDADITDATSFEVRADSVAQLGMDELWEKWKQWSSRSPT